MCDEDGGNFDEEDKRRLDALANGSNNSSSDGSCGSSPNHNPQPSAQLSSPNNSDQNASPAGSEKFRHPNGKSSEQETKESTERQGKKAPTSASQKEKKGRGQIHT